ncbi:hypothetical protein EDB84DRAFT_1571258 [Lactarius hengduanensis]|nr:hypothetical protein EDB84DRAFT_1571258 [Lactarius hengduanensis]
MLPDAHMRTLRGPRPTPFTGDPAQAQQFLDEFRQLEKANPRHPFLYRPELRVRLALKHIDKNPKTDAWIHDAQSRDSGLTDEIVWNDFLDSFCETWIYSPKSTISVVAPIVQPLTEVPSLSPAIASTLKHGTIDLTEDDADDWTLFAPRTSAPPPISPSSLTFDRLSPIKELPHPLLRTQIAPVMTRNESSDPPPPLPLTVTLDRLTWRLPPQQRSKKALSQPPSPRHPQTTTTYRASRRPVNPRAQIRPTTPRRVTPAGGRFKWPFQPCPRRAEPRTPRRTSTCIPGAPSRLYCPWVTPPCTFVTGANSLKGGVRTLDTSVLDPNFDAPPAPISPASSPNLSTHRRSPIAAPPRDDDDWSLFAPSHLATPSPSSPSPALFHTPTSVPSLGSLPSSPTNRCLSPSGIPPSPILSTRPWTDIDDDADAILFASPPPSSPLVSAPLPPPSLSSWSPPTFQSFPVVADDNVLIEGVKTFETSVLIPDIAFSNPSLTYYPPIFLPLQSTTRTATQNRRRQDSPRPPDVDEVARHAMTRTLGRCPKSRKSSGQGNNQQNDATTVDPTTPHALRRRPHIRFADNRDRHTRPEQEETTEVMDMSPHDHARAALQNRINTWRTQIVPEQTSRSHRPARKPEASQSQPQNAVPTDAASLAFDGPRLKLRFSQDGGPARSSGSALAPLGPDHRCDDEPWVYCRRQVVAQIANLDARSNDWIRAATRILICTDVFRFKYSPFLSFFFPNTMSARPSRTIYPSAKLTADNAGELELTSHRRAVASAASVVQHRPPDSPASTTVKPTPPNSDNAPAPSLTPSDLAPARTSCKRPHDVAVNKPPSVPTLNDDRDGVLNSKKAKTQARPDTDTDTGMHSDVEVMDIDDVDDPRDETLNKTDPTADIKAFFTALPRVPGQAKQRMSCNLCA